MRKKHTGRNIPFGGSLRSLGRCGQTRYISPVYDGRPDGSSVLDLSGRWASHQERVNRFAARAFGRFFFFLYFLSLFPPLALRMAMAATPPMPPEILSLGRQE